MTAATSRLRRRGIGAGVAALVGLTGLGLAAAPAQADANFALTRPADTTDRFATAASVATSAFTTSTNVIIANGDNAVDALSAAYLAGTTTPILYVTSTSVPAATAAAITKLGATNAWVVGGTTAIPDSVMASLSTTTETRVAGDDRYKTAVAVGNAKAAMGTKPTTAFIARGDQFADALAIAPVAAKSGVPILLTETGSLNADTLAALKAWGITSVTIVGGPSAVSENVATSLTAEGVTSNRIAGSTRSSTATEIANTAAFGFAKTSVYVVNGFRPVDALPAAVAAAKANVPILLTEDGVLGEDSQGYLTTNAATLTGGVAVGGTTVLPQSVEDAAETAAKAVTSNQTITVTPADAATLTTVSESGTTATSDDRVYTATGLNADLKYRVTLVDADNITVTNGVVTFLKSGSTPVVANRGTVTADITVVNGVPTRPDSATEVPSVGGIVPSNGSISFRVDGETYEQLVPVVYVDGGANTALELNEAGAPIEAFGLGGQLNYLPPAAGNLAESVFAPVDGESPEILQVDKATNTLIVDLPTGPAALTYDDNDAFFITTEDNDGQVVLADFEDSLTAGDSLIPGTEYRETAAFQSTFVLANTEPGQLTISSVDASDTTATVNIADVDVLDDASVRVYVAEGADANFEDADLSTTATVDADDDESGYQVNITGLTAGQEVYTVFATQVVEEEESEESTGVEFATLNAASDVTLTSATSNDINNGVGGTSEVILTFSDTVTPRLVADLDEDGEPILDGDGDPVLVADASGFSVSPTNQSGIVINAASVASGANDNQIIVTLETSGDASALDDATTDISYTVTVDAGSVVDEDGGPNVERTATFNY